MGSIDKIDTRHRRGRQGKEKAEPGTRFASRPGLRSVDKKDTRYKTRAQKLQNKEKPAVHELLTAGVVDLKGFEPSTSRMRTERSPS